MKKKNKLKLRSGQTDYTDIRWAPVINCVLKYRGKILLVQRSTDLRLYPGYWNGISGFLDDHKSLDEKIRQELKEELGLTKKHILSIKHGQIFEQDEPKYKKTWIVHPVLVTLNTARVTLDWEASGYRWLKASGLRNLKLLPGFYRILKMLLVI